MRLVNSPGLSCDFVRSKLPDSAMVVDVVGKDGKDGKKRRFVCASLLHAGI